ncbi:hypothetical protein D3C80_618790 [compost metagenome]
MRAISWGRDTTEIALITGASKELGMGKDVLDKGLAKRKSAERFALPRRVVSLGVWLVVPLSCRLSAVTRRFLSVRQSD